jgi:hypothetical protein
LILHLLFLDPGKDKVLVLFQLVLGDAQHLQLALQTRVQCVDKRAPLRLRRCGQRKRRRHDRGSLVDIIVMGVL